MLKEVVIFSIQNDVCGGRHPEHTTHLVKLSGGSIILWKDFSLAGPGKPIQSEPKWNYSDQTYLCQYVTCTQANLLPAQYSTYVAQIRR